jgi:hypothetical protein
VWSWRTGRGSAALKRWAQLFPAVDIRPIHDLHQAEELPGCHREYSSSRLTQSISRAFSASFSSASFFAVSVAAFVFFRSIVTLSIFPVNLFFPFA